MRVCFDSIREWCEAHGFQWAFVGGKFYWQTNYQTAELTADNKLTWHNWHYFNQLIGKEDENESNSYQ